MGAKCYCVTCHQPVAVPVLRKCAVCGVEMVIQPPRTRSNRKYCSDACSSKAYRRRHPGKNGQRLAELERENARLRAELERRAK
jgi:hypothetical protein